MIIVIIVIVIVVINIVINIVVTVAVAVTVAVTVVGVGLPTEYILSECLLLIWQIDIQPPLLLTNLLPEPPDRQHSWM